MPPNQSLELYSIRLDEKEKLLENELTIEVFYFNRFGDPRTLLMKFSKNYPPLLIHERIEKPGVLLNSLEEIIFGIFTEFNERFQKNLYRNELTFR